MPMLTCPGCGNDFKSKKTGRTYCSVPCRSAHYAQRRQETLAEFHWIRGYDNWDNVATRLGFPGREAMARFLALVGEKEWANVVEAGRRERRRAA